MRQATVLALFTSLSAALTLYALPIQAWADVYRLEATEDFPVLDAGAAPYYSEAPHRSSLAIDAAVIAYRNVFARATTVFEGPDSLYDITLMTLSELDGEADYRIFVDDVLIGTATNTPVTVDYTPLEFTFEQVMVPNGATLAVESLANTNGLIPEGDGTAFARGRWTALILSNDQQAAEPADQIDLQLQASATPLQISVGDSATVTVTISNATTQAVATQPRLTLSKASAELILRSDSLSTCSDTGNDVVCELAELAAGSSTTVEMQFEALLATPEASLNISVAADQTEMQPVDNSVPIKLTISQVEDAGTATTSDSGSDTDTPDNNAGVDSGTGDSTDAMDENAMNSSGTVQNTTAKSGGGATGMITLLALMGLILLKLHRPINSISIEPRQLIKRIQMSKRTLIDLVSVN